MVGDVNGLSGRMIHDGMTDRRQWGGGGCTGNIYGSEVARKLARRGRVSEYRVFI